MRKKTLIILFVLFAILFINTICFAEDIKQDIHNTTDSIIDGMTSTGEKIRNGISTTENTVENTVKNISTDIRSTTNDMTNNYNATRTSTFTDTSTNNMTSTWAWVIIALAVAVIIGLTWYYLAQFNSYHD